MSKHLVAVGSNQVQSLLETKQGEREAVKGKEKLRAL